MLELPNKILVIRLSSIGDIILTSPLLRILRKKICNNARIDFVVKKEFAELVKFNHHVSIVHEFDSKLGFKELKKLKEKIQLENYELVVDLHNNLRSIYLRNLVGLKDVVTIDKLLWERFQLVHFKRNIYKKIIPVTQRYISALQEYGIEDDKKGLEIFIPDEILFEVSGRIASLNLKNFEKTVALCPGAKHFTKRWQKEKFVELGKRLAALNYKILLFGGKDDDEQCSEIEIKINKSKLGSCTSFAGKFTLLQSAAAIEFCDLIVTNDSALMHIASAKQKKVVAIFGSSVKEFGFAPFQTENIILERNDVECRPCSHIGRGACPKKHFNCMELISTDKVFNELNKILK